MQHGSVPQALLNTGPAALPLEGLAFLNSLSNASTCPHLPVPAYYLLLYGRMDFHCSSPQLKVYIIEPFLFSPPLCCPPQKPPS